MLSFEDTKADTNARKNTCWNRVLAAFLRNRIQEWKVGLLWRHQIGSTCSSWRFWIHLFPYRTENKPVLQTPDGVGASEASPGSNTKFRLSKVQGKRLQVDKIQNSSFEYLFCFQKETKPIKNTALAYFEMQLPHVSFMAFINKSIHLCAVTYRIFYKMDLFEAWNFLLASYLFEDRSFVRNDPLNDFDWPKSSFPMQWTSIIY